ncbi:MAG: hypothetical protein ACLGI3_04130, partial [Actinomycetes bacterium]
MRTPTGPQARRLGLGLACLLLAACGGGDTGSSSADGGDGGGDGALKGLIKLAPGDCAGGAPTGSYFRMISPGGSPEQGPFVKNGDSACSDKNYSLLAPGSDGGLELGGFQAFPDPAFDASGNGLAGAILKPVKFFGIDFALACAETDAQTKAKTEPPTLTADESGAVTGTIPCWQAAYNNAYYNQGAPKPDGSNPG